MVCIKMSLIIPGTVPNVSLSLVLEENSFRLCIPSRPFQIVRVNIMELPVTAGGNHWWKDLIELLKLC